MPINTSNYLIQEAGASLLLVWDQATVDHVIHAVLRYAGEEDLNAGDQLRMADVAEFLRYITLRRPSAERERIKDGTKAYWETGANGFRNSGPKLTVVDGD